jgi:hypothetical protein
MSQKKRDLYPELPNAFSMRSIFLTIESIGPYPNEMVVLAIDEVDLPLVNVTLGIPPQLNKAVVLRRMEDKSCENVLGLIVEEDRNDSNLFSTANRGRRVEGH